jgi:tyrosinase
MATVRRNVYELGNAWADPVLWYARGVKAMKDRPIGDRTSWRFWAAMHGFDPPLWRALGRLSSTDPLPPSRVVHKFWRQCQHATWYFLPWHRGYLLAFEATVRAAVVQLGGPADWALPYWNYFKAGQKALPAEFASAHWPDSGQNPLYERHRYGPGNDGNVYVPLRSVNLDALADHAFSGVANGGNPGFGGVDTGFSHSGGVFGGIESQPHNMVHVKVGGEDVNNAPFLPGLMSDPDTAALDPIFWLHHANIDRLWTAWNHGPPRRSDPKAAQWLDGPAAAGQRAFVMPRPDGTTWTYAPRDVLDIHALGYRYDDLSPTGQAAHAAHAAEQPASAARSSEGDAMTDGDDAAASGTNVELVGASEQPVAVTTATSTDVRLATGTRTPTAARGARDVTGAGSGGRFFLNLENVRGQSDAAAFSVYVGVPAGESVEAHPELAAGAVAPFGLRKASDPNGEQAGAGLTFVLDITRIVHELHADDLSDVASLPVQVVPDRDLPERARITIGRISVYRQET